MKWIVVLAFGLGAAPVLGQQITTPIQAERLNLSQCLIAAEQLGLTYRTHLNKACVEIPIKVCARRGAAVICLLESLDQLAAFYAANRSKLPQGIQGTQFQSRAYAKALRDNDLVFQTEHQDLQTEAALTAAYRTKAYAVVDLFYRARQAGITLK